MYIRTEAKYACLAVKGSQTLLTFCDLAEMANWWQTHKCGNRLCVCMTLVFSMRSLYFHRQRLALTSLLLNKGLVLAFDRIGKTVREREETWFCCAPAWAQVLPYLRIKSHSNAKNTHPQHPCLHRWRDKGPEKFPDFPQVEWLVSGKTGT